MRRAARRNGFERLQVVHGAVSASAHPVRFVESSIHSHVHLGPGDSDTVSVPTVTVDALVGSRGWSGVDLIKMDIEGNEPAALAGMGELFADGSRPPIVFECNYELLMNDHLRPGVLVEARADGVQTECVSDYLAVARRPEDLDDLWQIDPPFTVEQTIVRLLDSAASSAEGYRRYAAQLIVDGPEWLRSRPQVQSALAALQVDESSAVRGGCERPAESGPATAHADTPEPDSGTVPRDAAVWVAGVHLRETADEPDLPPGVQRAGRPEELQLEDLWFYVRRGELLALHVDQDAGSLLLSALDGLVRPSVGGLHTNGPTILLSALGDGLEQRLTVAENVLLFAAFLGCHVPETGRRLDELGSLAAILPWMGSALCDTPPAVAARIALTVALACAQPSVLLIDRLPALEDSGFQTWARTRAGELCAGGMAIVQVTGETDRALAPPARMLWIEGRSVRCCGHAASVSAAAWRRRLDPDSHGYRPRRRAKATR
jgi:FkbM family methyltransferase